MSSKNYLCNLIANDKYTINLHGECNNLWYIIHIDNVGYMLSNSGKEIPINKLNQISISNLTPMSGKINIYIIGARERFEINKNLTVKYIYSGIIDERIVHEYEITHTFGSVGPVGQHGGLRFRSHTLLNENTVIEHAVDQIKPTIEEGHGSYALNCLNEKPCIINTY